VPVSLKGKVQSPISPDNPDPGATRLPAPVSRRSSSPIPSRPVEKSRAAPAPPRPSPILPPIKPERKLSEDEARYNHHNAVWVFSVPIPGGRVIRVVFPKSVVVRTAKSVILAAKVNPAWLNVFQGLTYPCSRCSLSPRLALLMAGYTFSRLPLSCFSLSLIPGSKTGTSRSG